MAEFSNPNQQGGQSGQSLTTMMILIVAVILGVQFYKSRITPPPPASSTPPVAAKQTSTTPSATPGAAQQPDAAKAAASAVPAVQAAAESLTVVENDLYRITFSNRGGDATSWILKQYKDINGKPLDVVHQQAAGQFGYPLSIYTPDASVTAGLNKALYVASATGNLAAPATLSFKYSSGDIQATKTFTFDPTTYVLHAEVSVTRGGVLIPALVSWPGGFGDQNETSNETAYSNAQFDTDRNGSDQHLAPKKVNPGESLSGPFDWAGVSDPFFAAVFLPDSPASATITTLRNDLDVAKTIKREGYNANTPPTKPLILPVLGAAMGNTNGPTETRIFVGPKALNVLKSVHATGSKVTLEPMLDFGFWGPVGKTLFLTLLWIHSHIVTNWPGPWGWSIVLLTIAISLLTVPFKIKTMQSALKMQRIQPQMDAIKERYKKYKVTDPKRNEMNAEIMQLQKDNGVNMFGGCIPSLITMPLFIAFFTMLPRVVELRQAHWFWLPNLQAADPWHILPILTVISQFLVQYYTPSPGVDPQQQKMMAFMMPAFFGYMTWTYASGLALYWAISNLIGIIQQAIMNRTSLGQEMREIAAKRARRKATTIQGRK